jgi:hypothetical protein
LLLCGWIAGGVARATAAPIEFGDLSPYQVIRARSAWVLHGDQQTQAPASLIDGTGLTDENPLLAYHGTESEAIWQHPVGQEYPVSIEFDLGSDYLINELWIWQLPGELKDRGLQDFEIVMRDASRRELGTLIGALDRFDRVGVQPAQRYNAFGECIFLPIAEFVRSVELRIHRNRGDQTWVGLAEVAFAGWGDPPSVPEPGGLTLLVTGLLASLARRRRRT